MSVSLVESCLLQTLHYPVQQPKLLGAAAARRANFKMLLDRMVFLARERAFRGVG